LSEATQLKPSARLVLKLFKQIKTEKRFNLSVQTHCAVNTRTQLGRQIYQR